MRVSEEYEHGRRDGLRLALAILAAEEAKWAALLGESRSWRTNATREVRHKALQVAQKRVQTALNRLSPKDSEKDDSSINEELASALDKLGL
jgi:glutamyl-tRNA reductase